jgi:hypothetical protein
VYRLIEFIRAQLIWAIPALISIIVVQSASAGLITYTDRAAFLFDVGGSTTTEGFDSFAPGVISDGQAVGAFTFSYDFGGVQLTVSTGFDTTSSPNYLGTDDGGILQDGDDLNFSFGAVRAFGLSIISLDPLLNGDFTLTVNGTVASLLSGAVQQTLGDGSSVWFLGIASDDSTSFTTAELQTHGGGGAFLYNLDDFTTAPPNVSAVPEPSSLILLLTGCGALGWKRRRSLWMRQAEGPQD